MGSLGGIVNKIASPIQNIIGGVTGGGSPGNIIGGIVNSLPGGATLAGGIPGLTLGAGGLLGPGGFGTKNISAPPAPDFNEVARTQGQNNLDVARLNSRFSNPNVNGPAGSQTVTWNGDQATVNQQLSPDQQRLFDMNTQMSQRMGQTGLNTMNRVDSTLGQPFDMSGVPGRVNSVGGPALQRDLPLSRDFAGAVDNSGVQRSLNTAGMPAPNFDFSRRGVQTGVDLNTGGRYDFNRSAMPGQVDLNVGGRYDFARGQVPQNVDLNIGGQSTFARGQVQNNVAGAGDAARNAAEQALYGRSTARLDPRFTQGEDALRSNLVAQGLHEGTTAYDNALRNFNMQKNDAYSSAMNDAIAGGGAEQQRQFGMNLQQGQFSNSAQAQDASQNLAGAGLFNDVANQLAQRRLQAGQFAQQGQAQEAGQNLQSAGLYNQAAQNEAQNRLAAGNFGLARQGQEAGQNLQSSQLYNQASEQEAQRRLSMGNFANTAQGQEAGQNLAGANLGNTAQQQMFGQRQAEGTFANAAQGQDFGQRAQNVDLVNKALLARNQATLQGGQFNNQAAELGFNQNLAGANLTNAQRQAQVQENAFLRSLPLSELNSLRAGSGATMPNFQNYTGATAAPAPIFAGAQATDAAQLDRYNAQMQQQNALMGTLGQLGAGAMFAFSDARLKRQVKRVGQLPSGLPVYEYEYLWGGGRQIGVMAHEVAALFPEAIRWVAGYMQVNYARIG